MIVNNSDERSSLTEKPAADNERLVLAIAAGDRDAERAFVEMYLRPVRAMLLNRSRNPDIAADLQQDVMIEALCALRRGAIEDPQKLAGFVCGIARNLLNNYFRSNRRTESLELPDDLPDLSCGLDKVEDELREAQAVAAIATLEPLDRCILQMTLVDGMKPAAIAERLQMSSDVVRQRKLRATRRVIELVSNPSQTQASDHLGIEKEP
jgi:RNA polymerase sigma-70 factor (ECF subfamily)